MDAVISDREKVVGCIVTTDTTFRTGTEYTTLTVQNGEQNISRIYTVDDMTVKLKCAQSVYPMIKIVLFCLCICFENIVNEYASNGIVRIMVFVMVLDMMGFQFLQPF